MISPREDAWRVNGLSHHVITWDGGGAPVVLCHGFLDIAWSWRDVARELAAAGRRVVAFDWRGHGESEWIGAGGYYHFPDYVRDLGELVRRAVGDDASPIDLVGHSMGGTACAMFSGAFPERVRRLVLIEGLGPPEQDLGDAPNRVRAWFRGLEDVRGKPRRPMASIADVLTRMRVQNPDVPADLGALLAEKSTRPAPEGTGRIWTFDPLHKTTSPMPFVKAAFLAFTSRITAPTLLVNGSRGFRTPDDDERASTIPDVRRVWVDGAGHMIHWTHARELAAGMREHFDREEGA